MRFIQLSLGPWFQQQTNWNANKTRAKKEEKEKKNWKLTTSRTREQKKKQRIHESRQKEKHLKWSEPATGEVKSKRQRMDDGTLTGLKCIEKCAFLFYSHLHILLKPWSSAYIPLLLLLLLLLCFCCHFCLVSLVFVSFSKSFMCGAGVTFFRARMDMQWASILRLKCFNSKTFTWCEFCLFTFSFHNSGIHRSVHRCKHSHT